jgi:opacity protein-like surface antigen
VLLLATEASYLDLGTLRYRVAGTGTASSEIESFSVDLDVRSRGPGLALLWALPMSNAWGLDVRLGGYRGKTTSKFLSTINANPIPGEESSSEISLLGGLGGSYVVSGHLAVRLDYTHVRQLKEKGLNDTANVNMVTAGLTYAF